MDSLVDIQQLSGAESESEALSQMNAVKDQAPQSLSLSPERSAGIAED